MRLHDVLQPLVTAQPSVDLPSENPSIAGICQDSRRVEAGDLYVAIRGEQFDGREFASDAAQRGASAVLGPAPDTEKKSLQIPWVTLEDPRRWLGPLSAHFYGQPQNKLLMVGVTGTNGKSTVIALVARLLQGAGRPTGQLGTLGYRFGDYSLAGKRTTPEASDLFRALAEMESRGAQAAVMEVSSHALAMGRVDGASFDVAVFTNLTHDHLDFHQDMETYFAEKRKLFGLLKSEGRSVIHLGDSYGVRLAEEFPDSMTYGPGGRVEVLSSSLSLNGIHATLATPRGEVEVESPLRGRFNLENILGAVAVAEVLELPHEVVVQGIADLQPLPGRLEPVYAGQPFPVLIDYAHTPAALEAALRSLRELTDHKIVVVFGCGGGRDRAKRPTMGEIAGRWSDLPVATSDNPREEDPQAILSAIEVGLKASGNPLYRMVPDRREAIRGAVAAAVSAEGQWAVLVAGKGHEETQIIGDQVTQFSDRAELEAILRGFSLRNKHAVRHG